MSKARSSQVDIPVTTFRQKLLLIAFGLALFLGGLAIVEGALALFGVGDDALYDDPFVGFSPGKELFERRTLPGGESVYATRPEKLRFFNHQQFPVAKAPGTYRIFALGGSTTAGRPYDDKVAFCRWLELYLEAMDPSRHWQAINAGAISYASYRVVVLIKELVRYEPDLFVVYTGHNEFLEERSYAGIIHQNPLLKRLRFWLSGRRSYALARRGVLALRGESQDRDEEGRLEAEVDARLDGWTGLELYHRDAELERGVLQHFEHNLARMVAIARDHGARVIFIDPVSNLKDFSPFKSEPSAGLSATQVTRLEALVEDARSRLAAGDASAALDAAVDALAIDPEYADAHFFAGRARLAMGERDAARQAFVRAKDSDVAPLRALERVSELIAEIAEREDVPRVDLPAILAETFPEHGAIPGNELLLDHVHPDVATHSLIAERVIDVLVEGGVARRDASWTEARRQAVYDRVVGNFDRAYYAERDLNLSKVLGWAGKLEEARVPLERAAAVLPERAEVHLNLGLIHQKTGRLEEAAAAFEQAAGLDPDSAEARFNLGVVYGGLERLEDGVAALERAIRLRPDYPEAHYNLGVLLRRQGAFDRASESLGEAGRLEPGTAETHRQLGLALRDQGRLDEAVVELERALELAPGDPALRTALGVTYGRQGRLDEAVAELERAISEGGDYAEAFYNLGVVHSQREDAEAALAAYLRAVEIDPDHSEAHNNLGIFHAGRGDLETARRHLTRAIEIDSEYADATLNLGLVYYQAGYPEEAGQMLERAVELAPGNPRFHFTLATLYYERGRLEAARRHFAVARDGGLETPPEIQRELEAGQE